jgi:hypothetical protein
LYKTIFLKENERDIFFTLAKQGFSVDKLKNRLYDYISKKVHNNDVGYFIFKENGKIYKLIVLPKIIREGERAERDFIEYLIEYFRLNNIYRFDKRVKISNSILQLLIKSQREDNTSHDRLEEFDFFRKKAIILSIENFFKKHKNSKRAYQDYVSQSIKNRLNLKRNIQEINKSRIHQIERKTISYSNIATITYFALKLYSKLNRDDKILDDIKRVKSYLLKKFTIDRGYKLTFDSLQSLKVDRVFSKNMETRELLLDIKSLFGFERMYSDSRVNIKYRDDLNTSSLFINPSNFYEWYIYDKLKDYANKNSMTIQFDKKEKTTTEYFINEHKRSSNPDYILTDESKKLKIVIDAKWKVIEKIRDISSQDYLKLKFDSELLESRGYKTISYLIYPHIKIDDREFQILFEENTLWCFFILKVGFYGYKNINFNL